MSVKITGIGHAVPDGVLTNFDLEKMMDTSDEWITERTGIKERRIAPKGSATSEYAARASRKAMDMAGVGPEEIDAIIVATLTPDMKFPSTACFLQEKLGAQRAYAFDLNAACSGFIYSLTVAKGLIESGAARKVLVSGAELLSTIINFDDRSTAVLFGDGAGAVVLEDVPDEEGIICTALHSDGSLWELLNCPGGGSVYPISKEMIDEKLHYIRMNGNETFKNAVTRLVEVTREVLEKSGRTIDDIDLFIPHQANKRIIDAVAKRLGLSDGKAYLNLHKYGNTSAASIPIAMSEAWEEGALKKGDLLLISAFGAGLTWGSALIRM
ncbi:MAG: ketoacyl-ACP synthase III [Deltaproteobacteria bacterium]|nr:MAG: ketoacyl-ACP synthase III [Deltaproteobacteria bacterium]